MEAKICLNCGEPVGPGRSDKKYCSNECKSDFQNKEKKALREPPLPDFIAEINKILGNNWRILNDCLGTKDSVRMKPLDLSGRGFNFKFYTSERFNLYNDDVYDFCYDMGYKIIGEGEERRVVIVRNTEMVRLSGPAFAPPKTDSLG